MNKTEKLSEIRLYYKPNKQTLPKVSSSEDAYNHLFKFYNRNTLAIQEQFVVLYLNRANAVLGGQLCSIGGLTGTIADVRLILGTALKACACNIIISHNHPSGNLKPSGTDQDLTKKLKDAGKLMDITLLDHIIISPQEGGYFSFADEGLI
jgi:DNA repair protein RadC